MARPKTPSSPGEWQEAVNLAVGYRAIADAKMYGLLKGGPTIDVARCDKIIRDGAARGIRPTKPAHELALEVVNAINRDVAARTSG